MFSCCKVNIKHGSGFLDQDHDSNPYRILSYNFPTWVSHSSSNDSIPDLKFYCETGSHSQFFPHLGSNLSEKFYTHKAIYEG